MSQFVTLATLVPTAGFSGITAEDGTNTTVSGNGLPDNPLVVDSVWPVFAAGAGITFTGAGTIASPYTIAVSGAGGGITAEDGVHTTVSGDGSSLNPLIVNAIWPIFAAGANIDITGAGTSASPYTISFSGVMAVDGTHTTVTGIGTSVSPLTVNAIWPIFAEGTNITITGAGTAASPYTISATYTPTSFSGVSGNPLTMSVPPSGSSVPVTMPFYNGDNQFSWDMPSAQSIGVTLYLLPTSNPVNQPWIAFAPQNQGDLFIAEVSLPGNTDGTIYLVSNQAVPIEYQAIAGSGMATLFVGTANQYQSFIMRTAIDTTTGLLWIQMIDTAPDLFTSNNTVIFGDQNGGTVAAGVNPVYAY